MNCFDYSQITCHTFCPLVWAFFDHLLPKLDSSVCREIILEHDMNISLTYILLLAKWPQFWKKEIWALLLVLLLPRFMTLNNGFLLRVLGCFPQDHELELNTPRTAGKQTDGPQLVEGLFLEWEKPSVQLSAGIHWCAGAPRIATELRRRRSLQDLKLNINLGYIVSSRPGCAEWDYQNKHTRKEQSGNKWLTSLLLGIKVCRIMVHPGRTVSLS